jgi:hypothetical protein
VPERRLASPEIPASGYLSLANRLVIAQLIRVGKRRRCGCSGQRLTRTISSDERKHGNVTYKDQVREAFMLEED